MSCYHNKVGSKRLEKIFFCKQKILNVGDCNPNEKRLQLSLTEPISRWGADLNLRLIVINGQPALEVYKWGTPPPARVEGDPTTGHANPIIEIGANFIMIKQ